MSDRLQLLRDVFYPVMLNCVDWEENPDHYIPGTDLHRFVKTTKKHYRVTPEEWALLEPEMRKSVKDYQNL
jgi:hypothetical protein